MKKNLLIGFLLILNIVVITFLVITLTNKEENTGPIIFNNKEYNNIEDIWHNDLKYNTSSYYVLDLFANFDIENLTTKEIGYIAVLYSYSKTYLKEPIISIEEVTNFIDDNFGISNFKLEEGMYDLENTNYLTLLKANVTIENDNYHFDFESQPRETTNTTYYTSGIPKIKRAKDSVIVEHAYGYRDPESYEFVQTGTASLLYELNEENILYIKNIINNKLN